MAVSFNYETRKAKVNFCSANNCCLWCFFVFSFPPIYGEKLYWVQEGILFAGVDVLCNYCAFPLLCIVPVLVVAGEGREGGICAINVSYLALEGNLYYKTRRQTIQGSRKV